MTGLLHVWLRERRIGEVEQLRNGRLRLRFATEALDTWGVGARPLSLSLPLTDRRVQGDGLERFLDNLLPEGPVRGALEREHRIRPGDSFALLAEIGQECAGAVRLTAEDVDPGDGDLVALGRDEVDRLVANLPTLDPPAGQVVSASLGGVQSKVLLTRTADGWAWPARGAMSSHIVKPEPVTDIGVPDLVRWEEWALRLARTAGLSAAHAELADFDGRLALVVERFDRHDGRRSHQEDLTQALGIATRDKYESGSGERRLRRIAREAGAEARDPGAFVESLLRQVVFNLVVGNGDAHSKNYSLAIDDAATFAMTPLYDVAPVYLLDRRFQSFGHALAGQTRLRYLGPEHLVQDAADWGIPAWRARGVLVEVASAVLTALPQVDADVLDVDAVARQVQQRAESVLRAVDGVATGG